MQQVAIEIFRNKKWESSSFILPNSLLEVLRSYFRLFLQINWCWNLPSRLCNSSLREIILRIFTGSFDFVSFDFFIINPFIKLATKILTFHAITNILSKKWIIDHIISKQAWILLSLILYNYVLYLNYKLRNDTCLLPKDIQRNKD